MGYNWRAIHVKTGSEYTVLGEATNATNAQDGQRMVIYHRDGKTYVREVNEFTEKFRYHNAPASDDPLSFR